MFFSDSICHFLLTDSLTLPFFSVEFCSSLDSRFLAAIRVIKLGSVFFRSRFSRSLSKYWHSCFRRTCLASISIPVFNIFKLTWKSNQIKHIRRNTEKKLNVPHVYGQYWWNLEYFPSDRRSNFPFFRIPIRWTTSNKMVPAPIPLPIFHHSHRFSRRWFSPDESVESISDSRVPEQCVNFAPNCWSKHEFSIRPNRTIPSDLRPIANWLKER